MGERTDAGGALCGGTLPRDAQHCLVSIVVFLVGPSFVFIFTMKSIFLMEIAPR